VAKDLSMLSIAYYWIHNPAWIEKLGIQEKIGYLAFLERLQNIEIEPFHR
jgi:hypothetical protein